MKYIYVSLIAICVAGSAMWFLTRSNSTRIDTSFATSASLRYHYVDAAIDATIAPDDVGVLRDILLGRSYRDGPSCGFTLDVSVTLTDGRDSITFCPACDGCPKLRINDTDRYISISEDQRRRLDKILAKYGVVFPCV